MKSLFIVGAKIFGLVLLYRATESATNLVTLIGLDFSQGFERFYQATSYYIIPFLVQLAGGLLILFKGEWLARVFRIQSTEKSLTLAVSDRELLSIGIRLVGLFLMVAQLPGLLYFIQERIGNIFDFGFYDNIKIMLQVFLFLVPLYLIFGWRRLAEILDSSTTEELKHPKGSLRNLKP